MERLPMRKIREILRLRHEKGLSQRAVAAACGMGAGTVSEYLSRAVQAGVHWPLPPELDDSVLEARLFPTLPPCGGRVPPDLPWVHQELKKAGVTLLLLWEEYRQAHVESAYGYSQFCDIYRRWERKLKPSMRQVHRAGEKTFVDFSGKRPHIVDPKTGEWSR
jgi:transposase